MPSCVAHALVGWAAGRVFMGARMPWRFQVMSAIVPALPDLDTSAFLFGIPYDSFFGHRGFFHSLFFAVILGGAAALFYRRGSPLPGARAWPATAYFVFICATHGILDAFTNGGRGIALLSPFDTTRYFAPWRPIEVAPFGIVRMFSLWGLRVIGTEALWIGLPCLVALIMAAWLRRGARQESNVGPE